MRLRIVIARDEDGIFVVECPSLPGCISQGKTRTEAIKNIKDAIQGYLESLENHKEIAKGTMLAIIKQAGLTREEFMRLL